MHLLICSTALVGLGACSSRTRDDAEAAAATGCVSGQSGCQCADGHAAAAVSCDAAADSAATHAAAVADVRVAGGVGGMQQEPGTGAAGSSARASIAGRGGDFASSSAGGGGNPAPAGSGGAVSAGTGGSTGAAGASAADGGRASAKDCGEGAVMGTDKKGATKPAGTGRHSTGSVDFKVKTGNRIVRLQTTLEVPARPKGNSTLFMWPGLEPVQGVSMNYDPIGRGVLQPVLTWGSSCAPQSRAGANAYWISALYVNVTSTESGYNGCYGGDVMDTAIGDKLYIDMRLKDGTTIWNQSVTNLSNNKRVDFDFDLEGQDQNWALFEIEVSSATLPSSDVIFADSVLTMAASAPEACTPDSFGPNDYYSAPLVSMDGTKCCLERIVLREMGVPATTMDP
jgi:hypothetical protein